MTDQEIIDEIAKKSPNKAFYIWCGMLDRGLHEAIERAGSIDQLAELFTNIRQYDVPDSRRRQHERLVKRINEMLAIYETNESKRFQL